MPKLSIIVPIYNVAPFLDRSINSLINQTLEDIEIILINDGSTDDSLKICRKYQNIDDRIIVVDKKNEGVSATRNKGIEIARSEYITFMDPDDCISINMYENMYSNIIESKCDICLCNYINVHPNEKKTIVNLPYDEGVYLDSDIRELMLSMIGGNSLEDGTIIGVVWRGIFRKSLIKQYSIQFPIDISIMEDLVFIIDYLNICKKMYIDKNPYYYYCIRDNSALTGYNELMWNNNKKVCKLLYDIINNNLTNDWNEKLKYRIINSAISSIVNETHVKNKKNFKQKILAIKKIIIDKYVQNNIRTLSYNDVDISKKLILNLIKYKSSILLYMLYFIRIRIKIIQNYFKVNIYMLYK